MAAVSCSSVWAAVDTWGCSENCCLVLRGQGRSLAISHVRRLKGSRSLCILGFVGKLVGWLVGFFLRQGLIASTGIHLAVDWQGREPK